MKFEIIYALESKNFEEEAYEEAKQIVKYFSRDEINKLQKNLLDPVHGERCIYGLMTGDCNSRRAVRFIKTLPKGYIESRNFLDSTEKIFNSKIDDIPEDILTCRSVYFMTPLECYIYDEEDNSKGIEIIDFIKKSLKENNGN